MSSQSPSQPTMHSQQRRTDTVNEAEWWQLSTTDRTVPRPHPPPNSLATTPSLAALHAETLSLQTEKAALSSVLCAVSASESASVCAIAALDVRLRSLILSMAQYSRTNPSAPEQQAVHAIHAAAEANKVS